MEPQNLNAPRAAESHVSIDVPGDGLVAPCGTGPASNSNHVKQGYSLQLFARRELHPFREKTRAVRTAAARIEADRQERRGLTSASAPAAERANNLQARMLQEAKQASTLAQEMLEPLEQLLLQAKGQRGRRGRKTLCLRQAFCEAADDVRRLHCRILEDESCRLQKLVRDALRFELEQVDASKILGAEAGAKEYLQEELARKQQPLQMEESTGTSQRVVGLGAGAEGDINRILSQTADMSKLLRTLTELKKTLCGLAVLITEGDMKWGSCSGWVLSLAALFFLILIMVMIPIIVYLPTDRK